MQWLSEDPTYLAGGLGVLALIMLIAVRATQQGKFLVMAGAALALALLVVVVERLWVTDAERIEQVVYDLRRAVQASDAEGVLGRLTPDVQYVRNSFVKFSGEGAREFIRTHLGRAKFDFVRIARLKARAGRQTRRGDAEFRVIASGSYETSGAMLNFGAANLDFSLGLRETAPDVWKVERIVQLRAPRDMPTR